MPRIDAHAAWTAAGRAMSVTLLLGGAVTLAANGARGQPGQSRERDTGEPTRSAAALFSRFYASGPATGALPEPGVPALPSWQRVPRTASSVPIGTVVLPDAPATLNTVPLSEYGYVEEEYFLSGSANIYSVGGKDVVEPDVAYTTRILVRRPADPNQFSGSIVLEPSRDLNEWTTSWLAVWPYMLGRGDVFVTFTMARGNLATHFEKFDPVRYAPLELPDDGLRWDIMAQTAWLMRSPKGPLAQEGFLERAAELDGGLRLYSTGASLTGFMQSLFIDDGHHARARRPDGGPVIDGYLATVSGGPRQPPADAAVIVIQSESELARPLGGVLIWEARRPDSDDPIRFRWYEIAGTGHANWTDQSQFSVPYHQLGIAEQVTVRCAQPAFEPGKVHFTRAALANLESWVRLGIPPPPGRVIDLSEDHAIERDEYGNALGGLRPHWVAVPTSTLVPSIEEAESTGVAATGGLCRMFAHEEVFPEQQLAKLYESHDIYLSQVKQVLDALVAQHYLLPRDAERELERARLVRW